MNIRTFNVVTLKIKLVYLSLILVIAIGMNLFSACTVEEVPPHSNTFVLADTLRKADPCRGTLPGQKELPGIPKK